MTGDLRCPLCDFVAPPTAVPSLCPTCGVPLDYRSPVPFGLTAAGLTGRGVWRYAPLLPDVEPLTLGEGGTPLVPSRRVGPALGVDLLFKVEGANPTGSFKDRGAAVLVAVLRSLGARAVTDDSSGNAGAALAAYAARAGMRAVLYVPAHASGPKLAQIMAHGAELVRVAGPRERAAEAVTQACQADPGLVYASHNASPYFPPGLATVAYELFEDLGAQVPDHVVVPVGGGGLLLGLADGFTRLRDMGWTDRVPPVHAVQPAACAPIVRAWVTGGAPREPAPGQTVAEGTRIPNPSRGQQILATLRAAGGEAVAVEEEGILAARLSLAREEGLYVEPTAALGYAALPQLVAHGAIRRGERVVVVLTGCGLKAPAPAVPSLDRRGKGDSGGEPGGGARGGSPRARRPHVSAR